MVRWAEDVIAEIGLLGVAVLVALESVIPPIPSELVLLLTGSQVAEGQFGLVAALLMSTIGSMIGALVLYAGGRLLSPDAMDRLVLRVGKYVGFTAKDVERGFAWFERRGSVVVFFGRMVPVVRSVVSIPAGAERMPLRTFVPFTFLGSLVWNTVWVVVGRSLGPRWKEAERAAEIVEFVVLGGAVAGLAFLLVRRRRAKV